MPLEMFNLRSAFLNMNVLFSLVYHEHDVRKKRLIVRMTEQIFNIRKDVFGVLGKLTKNQIEVWWLMLKLMECQEPWNHLPTKLRADARVLVAAGIVLEDEKGMFCVNPEVVYLSDEPTSRATK